MVRVGDTMERLETLHLGRVVDAEKGLVTPRKGLMTLQKGW